MELDHETLNRRYNNFEEDIPEEDDIEVQELGETPTLTSPVTEIPKDDEVLPPLLEFSRAKGVIGAGKTTLMDVLTGRKTGAYVNGDIKISGYPKKQETFVEKMKMRMRRTLKNVKILDGFFNLF
ncbi:hypothetical protein FXO37_09706 [Capsicum annuum]|nr:hypothetical protein FXO37_09706 [Capsicum annuum]